MKSVQIWSFFWSAFSRIRTEYGPEKTPYLDTFHAVEMTDRKTDPRVIPEKTDPRLIPRSALLTISKTFARTHLDYVHIIYEKAYNSSFHQKIEFVQ